MNVSFLYGRTTWEVKGHQEILRIIKDDEVKNVPLTNAEKNALLAILINNISLDELNAIMEKQIPSWKEKAEQIVRYNSEMARNVIKELKNIRIKTMWL